MVLLCSKAFYYHSGPVNSILHRSVKFIYGVKRYYYVKHNGCGKTKPVRSISSETTMSIKGQIVILKDIRVKLNLKQNQKFREYIEDDRIVLEPVVPIAELGGSLKNMARRKTKKQLRDEIKSGWK